MKRAATSTRTGCRPASAKRAANKNVSCRHGHGGCDERPGLVGRGVLHCARCPRTRRSATYRFSGSKNTETGVFLPNRASDIRRLALYDDLTQLPNRRLLLDRLQWALAACARSGRRGALLLIDLDNFKELNDTHGHDHGDLLLQQVAQRLNSCVREADTAARLGGDEFVVMLTDLSDNAIEARRQAEAVGGKILATLNAVYDLLGKEHRSTPSIGITLFADQRTGIDQLLKQADLAMYRSKASGRNTLRFFDAPASL